MISPVLDYVPQLYGMVARSGYSIRLFDAVVKEIEQEYQHPLSTVDPLGRLASRSGTAMIHHNKITTPGGFLSGFVSLAAYRTFANLGGWGERNVSAQLSGSLGQLVGTSANLIYNNSTGVLAYDSDGAGAGAALPFAIVGLGPHPSSLGSDFLIVA